MLPPDAPFTTRIHQALAAYLDDEALAAALGELCSVRAALARDPARGLPAACRVTLDDALHRLAGNAPKQAELLVERFVRGQTAHAAAYALNYSERALFTRQKEAVAALAQIIWDAEEALRCAGSLPPEQQATLDRLPPPTFSRLFGVDEALAQLQGCLRAAASQWLVALEGMGGIGKTALARAAAETLVREGRFARVVWITAQQERFAWAGLEEAAGPALTFPAFLDQVAQAVSLRLRGGLDEDALIHRLRPALAERPTLIVVDNLETAADLRALTEGANRLARPAKVLLTTRQRVAAYDPATSLTLRQLLPADALAFLRYHGQERHVPAITQAPEADLLRMVAVTDGNPLAIKLVAGQLQTAPLAQVLGDLQAARPATHDFYHFLFRYAWERLSEPAQHLLVHMPLLDARGTTWDDLAAISGVALNGHFRDALGELVNMSLLSAGYVQGRMFYSIHRLTEYFILSDLVGPRPV